MKNKQEQDFIFENINNKRYCTLNIDENNVILEYEINMIKNNPSLPFLEIDIIQLNSNKKALYKLDNKVSLFEIIENNRYDIEKIIEILENVFKCANNMKEFMLDNRKIVLDYKSIYLNSDLVPYMIYLPFKDYGLKDIEEKLSELFESSVNLLKSNGYSLTNNDKKMLNKITKNRLELDEIGKIFAEYKRKKDEEKLLVKPAKIKDKNEESYYVNKEESNYEKEINKDVKSVEKKNYKSVIEEDYSEFDDFDDEEDLKDYLESEIEYEEYKDIYQYDKKMDSRQKDKKIIIIQLIFLMVLGSLGLIISYDDKKIFISIAIGMLVVIIIFTFLIISNNKSKE